MKRRPNVPREGWLLLNFSKADLFEAAWDLAAVSNDAGSADDDVSTAAKLLEMLNIRRQSRGARPVKPKA